MDIPVRALISSFYSQTIRLANQIAPKDSSHVAVMMPSAFRSCGIVMENQTVVMDLMSQERASADREFAQSESSSASTTTVPDHSKSAMETTIAETARMNRTVTKLVIHGCSSVPPLDGAFQNGLHAMVTTTAEIDLMKQTRCACPRTVTALLKSSDATITSVLPRHGDVITMTTVETDLMRLQNVLRLSARKDGPDVLLRTDVSPTGHSATDKTTVVITRTKINSAVRRVTTLENSDVPLAENVFQDAGCATLRTTVETIQMSWMPVAGEPADHARNLSSVATMESVFREARCATEPFSAVTDSMSRSAHSEDVCLDTDSATTELALLSTSGAIGRKTARMPLTSYTVKML